MSWETIYNDVTSAIGMQMQNLANLQQQVSTGEMVNQASDNPTAAYQIMSLDSSGDSLNTCVTNAGNVMTDMEQASSSLQERRQFSRPGQDTADPGLQPDLWRHQPANHRQRNQLPAGGDRLLRQHQKH